MRQSSFIAVGFAVVVSHATAQQPAQRIPVRTLSEPATAHDTLRSVSGVKQFADGRLVVNDLMGKRLVLYDSALATRTVVADTTGKPALYPSSFYITNVFEFIGDSALFPDFTSQAFLVIEPGGKIGRALAHPKSRDMMLLSQPYSGRPAFDQQARFIYRAASIRPVPSPAGTMRTRDTSAIVRASLESRTVDTVARISIPVMAGSPIVWDSKGVPSAHRVVDPMPLPPDEWAVTSNGTIGIIKAQDYHAEWVLPDGQTKSTPKMPFDWRRLTEADKQARVDSAKRMIDSLSRTPRPFGMMTAGRAGQTKIDTVIPTIEFVPLSSMPDYVPPFRAGSILADRDNRLWIPPTTTTIAAGTNVVYDVISTDGEIVERVLVPADRTIVGFGPGGIVFLTKGSFETGFILERRRIIRSGT